jgi:hypothetical protein
MKIGLMRCVVLGLALGGASQAATLIHAGASSTESPTP